MSGGRIQGKSNGMEVWCFEALLVRSSRLLSLGAVWRFTFLPETRYERCIIIRSRTLSLEPNQSRNHGRAIIWTLSVFLLPCAYATDPESGARNSSCGDGSSSLRLPELTLTIHTQNSGGLRALSALTARELCTIVKYTRTEMVS